MGCTENGQIQKDKCDQEMIIKKFSIFVESLKDKDMWEIIPDSVKELHNLFKANGKRLFLVGGSVRDFLTGDKPKDFDLSTDALPDEILEILDNRYRTNLQGKAFGVVVVFTEDQPEGMEIATFREDVSVGRNPEVKLGVTIEEDVLRRDLTYNALFYDLDKREIVDLVGGVKDLENKVTRMVGDPIERFNEDSLRILRAFRFAARYATPIEETTAKAIKERPQLENIDPETGKMKRISQERIWEEFEKAFKQCKNFKNYLEFFNQFDMWKEAFPKSNINQKMVESNSMIIHIANIFKFEDLKTFERKMVQMWKFPADVTKKAKFFISLLNFSSDQVTEFYKEKVRCHIEDDIIHEWINMNNINTNELIKFLEFKPSVDAKELMEQGFKGKQLGDEIKRLEVEKFKEMI